MRLERRATDRPLPRVRHLAEDGQSSRSASSSSGSPGWRIGRGRRRSFRTRRRPRSRRSSSPSASSTRRGGRGSSRRGSSALAECLSRRPRRSATSWLVTGSCSDGGSGGGTTDAHDAPRGDGAERRLVHRLQGPVPPRRRDVLLPADDHRPVQSLHSRLRGHGRDLRRGGARGLPGDLPHAWPAELSCAPTTVFRSRPPVWPG